MMEWIGCGQARARRAGGARRRVLKARPEPRRCGLERPATGACAISRNVAPRLALSQCRTDWLRALRTAHVTWRKLPQRIAVTSDRPHF